MNDKSLEHLSSLMDGEVSRETGIFLTRRLASDESLCATWERYHLIRECIRQPGSKLVVNGMCEKLNVSLGAEEPVSVPVWHQQRWFKPVSGMAIAASVALMALVFTAPQMGTVPESVTVPARTTAANQPFVSPNPLKVMPLSQPASFSANRQSETARLNAYLLRHNQMAGMADRQGFISFVPIVATTQVVSSDDADETSTKQETAEGK